MRRRDRAARRLGLTGLWLAALLTVGAWLGVWVTLAPARATLRDAQATLTRLDGQLADVQASLAPLDVLARPEALEAARTLEVLSEAAGRVPLLTTLFPDGALTRGTTAVVGTGAVDLPRPGYLYAYANDSWLGYRGNSGAATLVVGRG